MSCSLQETRENKGRYYIKNDQKNPLRVTKNKECTEGLRFPCFLG